MCSMWPPSLWVTSWSQCHMFTITQWNMSSSVPLAQRKKHSCHLKFIGWFLWERLLLQDTPQKEVAMIQIRVERWTEFATTVMQILLRVYCFVKKYWADQAMVGLGNPNADLPSVSAVFVGVLTRSCPPKVHVLFFHNPIQIIKKALSKNHFLKRILSFPSAQSVNWSCLSSS